MVGSPRQQSLTLITDRAGLLVGPDSKVTLNGVEVGKVASIDEIEHDGKPAAKFTLNVAPRYASLIPVNVVGAIKATTVFGGKYVRVGVAEESRAGDQRQ